MVMMNDDEVAGKADLCKMGGRKVRYVVAGRSRTYLKGLNHRLKYAGVSARNGWSKGRFPQSFKAFFRA